jgi:hypothetical protein
MFIAALFTIAKRWKQPKPSCTDGWTNEMWSVHTMEKYSLLKRICYIQYGGTAEALCL